MFVILDTWDSDYINTVCDEDGKTLTFDTEDEAIAYAEEECQKDFYLVVEL